MLKYIGAIAIACTMSEFSVAEHTQVCMPSDLDGRLEKKSYKDIRVATFNAFLNRNNEGDLAAELQNRDSAQVQAVAEIIQRVRPDILLLNEFDYDAAGTAIDLLKQNYLSVSQNQQTPIHYPYIYLAESNTGIDSGLDLDNNGSTGGPGDAFGFGFFPGQFGMVLLSRYPIVEHKVRTFQHFLWRDMPNALLPIDPTTGESFYSQEQLDVFRLSSKSHWDIPVKVRGQLVHILAAHPTPPVFDGEEDRNGRRNHDEIRFWDDYVGTRRQSRYIYDDNGVRGGLGRSNSFVILGDYNADPFDGDSTNNAILQLLDHPSIDAFIGPASLGGFEDAMAEGQMNEIHFGNAALDTADFNPVNPGNLRVDYVLPSKRGLTPRCGGVFWPTANNTTRYLVGDGFPVVSSDHHLVWLDMSVQRRKFRY